MITVELTRDSRARLRSLEKRFPKTMRAAFGAAAKRARRRLVKVMRQAGGVYGVPAMAPHNEISTYLRPGQKMGGMLAEPNYIVMFKRSPDEQVIGWPDSSAKPPKSKGKFVGLSEWARKFQEAETRPMKDWERDYLLRRGIFHVPGTYSRPERDVINSFAADLARDWPGLVLEMFEKKYMSYRAKHGAGSVR